MKELRNAFLRKSNIVIASLIASLGVGCKTAKTAAQTQEDNTTSNPQRYEQPAKKYGPPPPRPVKDENIKDEPIPLKYGGPAPRPESRPLLINGDEPVPVEKYGVPFPEEVYSEDPQPVKYGVPPEVLRELEERERLEREERQRQDSISKSKEKQEPIKVKYGIPAPEK